MMEDMREKRGKSIKSVIAALTRLNLEGLKRELKIKREKYVPYVMRSVLMRSILIKLF